MSRLSKISTLELERELLMRAIGRHGESIIRHENDLGRMKEKNLARLGELNRLNDQINAANGERLLATFARKVPGPNLVVKSTPRPLRKRSVKKAGVA